MNEEERDLVEVPENAMREDPLAFGLTAPQLGLAGVAAAIGFVLNLLPIWLPLRLTLAVVVAAPIFGTAIVSIRGEPGHRWLVRLARFTRSDRRWVVPAAATADPSGAQDLPKSPAESYVEHAAALSDPAAASDSKRAAKPRERGPRSEKPARPRTKPARVRSEQAVPDKPVRLRLVADEDDEAADSDDEPTPRAPAPEASGLPHLLRGFRLVCFLSFAGGVGKTTLAVETASLVGSVGRYVAQDGSEAPVRVLLLDATRFAPAAAIRLGVPPKDLSSAWAPDAWRDPAVARRFVVPTRYGVEVLTLPQHPRASGRDLIFENPDNEFLAGGAQTLLDAAHASDTALVVADLGSAIDEGHRQLIEHADLVLGVVRPTAESLADAYRLATMVRGLHSGRKLALVVNQADDDREASQVAKDAGLDLLAAIPRDPTFEKAAEVGEPAWRLKPELREALVPLARIVWPFFVERNGHHRVPGGVLKGILSGGRR
jgi:MinD-like ATPase involved in chromosome partitioning or flagellar assembly